MKDLKYLYEFEKLLESANNPLVQQACAEGKHALAYTCYHMPEVLLNTGDCFSVRLRAPLTGSLDISSYYMSNFICDYCKSLLERGIEGGYNFLSALLATETCSEMNRALEHFELLHLVDNEQFFVTFLDMPFKVTDNTVRHYVDQLRRKVLEPLHEVYGVDVSDDALRKAVGCYREAVNVARDEAEKINSLQRIAAIYKQIGDVGNLNKTREAIVHSLGDEYKRLGYMRLAQNNRENPKTAEWLEKALAYVTREEVSFLGKCQNTLSICKMLAQSYKDAGDKANARRIGRLLHKTARLTIQAMEDKTTAERSREKQLEWYGKMLEVALVYGKGDRRLKKQTAGRIVGLLEEGERITSDGMSYGRDGLKKMLSV